jgi:hypothetical protein
MDHACIFAPPPRMCDLLRTPCAFAAEPCGEANSNSITNLRLLLLRINEVTSSATIDEKS